MHIIRLSIGTFVPMLRKTYIIGSKSMIAFLFLIINSIMNGNNILNFAKNILSKSYAFDKSIAMRPGGTVWEGEATIENLKNWIQRQGEFKDWAVLCTTNDIID